MSWILKSKAQLKVGMANLKNNRFLNLNDNSSHNAFSHSTF